MSPGIAGRVGIDRGIEDGQQRRSQARGGRTRRRWRNTGGKREDELQEHGGDAKLHESGQVGRAIRRERDMHEDGESDTRNLVKGSRRHVDT